MAFRSPSPLPPVSHIRRLVKAALEEDLAFGDLTSNILLSNSMNTTAQILAKEQMVLAGMTVAKQVFQEVDPSLRMTAHKKDGEAVQASTPILTVTGKALSILQAERVSLNFLQRLCGIASLTRQFCDAVRKFPVAIVDTRKTTPGLRGLEKWAVRLGGGRNHRFSLHDGILIKDNHLTVLSAHKLTLRQACQTARLHAPHGLRICVEVDTLAQVREALQGKADVILLDNMPPVQVQQAVRMIRGKALVEVSGGISLDNVRSMAEAGANIISIGALTHSALSKDLSMDILPQVPKARPKKRASQK